MRRTAWFLVLVAAVALLLPSGGPAVAQATEPIPDFNNDGFGDLAVGFPGEDLGTAVDAGAVSVLYGSTGGLASDGQVLSQDTVGVPGSTEPGDRFGTALAVGRFNGDVFWDLAVGARAKTWVTPKPGRSPSCSAPPAALAARAPGCSPRAIPNPATASASHWTSVRSSSAAASGTWSSVPLARTSAARAAPVRSA